MPDIAMQIDIATSPDEAYRAFTTTDGVAGWWTDRNETAGTIGEVDLGWAQLLLRLREYLQTGKPVPFFEN